MEIENSEIILAMENLTILRLTGASEEKKRHELQIRYYEVVGMLQLANRIKLNDIIIKAMEDHRDWITRAMKRAR